MILLLFCKASIAGAGRVYTPASESRVYNVPAED